MCALAYFDLKKLVCCAPAIISRGLYIFYPIFENHFFVFKEFLLENYVHTYYWYSRASYNGLSTVVQLKIFTVYRITNFLFVLSKKILKKSPSKVGYCSKIAEFFTTPAHDGSICRKTKKYKINLSFYSTWDM